jgi:hypothetical protein
LFIYLFEFCSFSLSFCVYISFPFFFVCSFIYFLLCHFFTEPISLLLCFSLSYLFRHVSRLTSSVCSRSELVLR